MSIVLIRLVSFLGALSLRVELVLEGMVPEVSVVVMSGHLDQNLVSVIREQLEEVSLSVVFFPVRVSVVPVGRGLKDV